MAMRASLLDAHELVSNVLVQADIAVAPLRAVDIVVWMHQYGWKNAWPQIEAPPSLSS